MRKFYILGAFAALFYFTSCTDDEIVIKGNTENSGNDATSEYGELPSDSLGLKYEMQTNPELILADRVISKGSKFVLDLSQEEATALHIAPEVYQKCLKHIEKLNNKSEK